MAVARRSTPDNLKIGDTVLLFYTANEESVTDSGHESGYILADLSGYVWCIIAVAKTLSRHE